MRPPIAPLAVLALCWPSVAFAQTTSHCKTLAQNARAVLGPAIVNLRRVESMDEHIATLKSASSGELRASLDRFDDARRDLAIAWREFISASRELRDRSEACSALPTGRGRH